ncbi:MAG: putative DNA binding domain-containing protein [Lachnospiraceae bacterium]|nr:putative DNA binding domain-containing protein [Lachnospiraceae bacterium]
MGEAANTIYELLSYVSEKEWFEFKENWYHADELGQYISALSNSAAIVGKSYAYFVWGVNDKSHEIVGTTFNFDQDVNHEPLKHYLARQLKPDINFMFEEVTMEGKRVVLLTIPAAKTVPTSYAWERYIRIGSSKENIKKYPERESWLFYVLGHGVPTIENTPAEYQDLTFDKLLIYYYTKNLKLNPDTFKKNLSLYTEDGRYNMMAQLLSDDSHMNIRIALFAGKTKADRLIAVREFGNQCLLYSLDDVLRYGDILNIMQADERDRIVERKEVPLFDNDAFREAVINAFAHNKWVSGLEPMISVFSDRIEILSRGSLAPEQTMEGFFAGESVPVNRKLSEILLQLHISEKTGRGVPKIIQSYGREAFEFRENSIVVTIPFYWLKDMDGEEKTEERNETEDRRKAEGRSKSEDRGMAESRNTAGNRGKDEDRDRTEESNKTEQDELPKSELNRTQERVLSEIRRNPNVTKAGLMDILHLGKTTIDKAIAMLKQCGYIRRVGSNRTGYWQTL